MKRKRTDDSEIIDGILAAIELLEEKHGVRIKFNIEHIKDDKTRR